MISKEKFYIDANDRNCSIIIGNETGIKNATIATAATGFSIVFDQCIKSLESAIFQIEGVSANFVPVLASDNKTINVAVKRPVYTVAAEVVTATETALPLGTQKINIILVIKS
jgi:hypothetical protein